MAKCAYCESRILFGPKRQGKLQFCNDHCLQQGTLLFVSDQVPQEVLDRQISVVHKGKCPQCSGEGPVDVHTSHSVWSILVWTFAKSKPQICCHSCGIHAKVRSSMLCLFLGWWAVPWGFILTPIQVLRNLAGLFFAPDPTRPSEKLQNMVSLMIADELIHAHANGSTQQVSSEVS